MLDRTRQMVSSPRFVIHWVIPVLLIFSLSCSLIVDDDPPGPIQWSGCRVKPNEDSFGVTDLWLVMEQTDNLIDGCVAVNRPNQSRVDYMPVLGNVDPTNKFRVLLDAPRSETIDDLERIEVSAVAGDDGELNEEDPLLELSSTFTRFNVGRLRNDTCTCAELAERFQGNNQVASAPVDAALTRVPPATRLLSSENVASIGSGTAPSRHDARFFGTFCQVGSESVCRRVRVGFGPFGFNRTECVDLSNARVSLEYFDGSQSGHMHGSGAFLLDGNRVPFAAAGTVESAGRAQMAVQLPGDLGRYDTPGNNSQLSVSITPGRGVDHRLQLTAFNETLSLSKQACDNRSPVVTLTGPANPELPWGATHCFDGRVTSDEDAEFPLRRMRLASDRTGEFKAGNASLSAIGTRGLRVCTSALAPGAHELTFVATDSGGLPARATLEVTVRNTAPLTPRIVQPLADDTLVAGGAIWLRGKAWDNEEGLLTDGALLWTASFNGAPHQFLGYGNRLQAALPEVGDYVLRLTATDGAGLQNTAERAVRVAAGDNAPPRVTIEVPDPLAVRGPFAGAFEPGLVTFRGTVADDTTALSDLQLTWQARAVQPEAAALPEVTGSTLAEFDLPLVGGGRTIYEVTFGATDTEGLTGRSRVRVIVWPDLPN